MNKPRRSPDRFVKWTAVTFIAVLGIVAFRFILGRPAFDADKVARAETRMWQAYYSGDRTELGIQLITVLRNQYGLSLFEAKRIAEMLAASAMKFRTSTADEDGEAFMLLVKAYGQIKKETGAQFDPHQAALAELAWWTARRTPGQNSAEQVGKKIAELYALLYGNSQPSFEKAGLLRAQAAELRDTGGKNADWPRVEELLKASYRELEKGI